MGLVYRCTAVLVVAGFSPRSQHGRPMSTSDPIWFTPPPRPIRPPSAPEHPAPSQVEIRIDGRSIRVPDTATILAACRSMGLDIPTLCYLENLTPANVCRVCVGELAGARTLVPPLFRKV